MEFLCSFPLVYRTVHDHLELNESCVASYTSTYVHCWKSQIFRKFSVNRKFCYWQLMHFYAQEHLICPAHVECQKLQIPSPQLNVTL